ncbi:MAG TPA: hypothetical protein VGG99_07075 [Acetobacteraceae bacterium]
MLIISRRQIEALARPSMERFEQRLIRRLRDTRARDCHFIGDDAAMLRAVRRIIALAQANGYRTARELTLYATLVFDLGIGFDTDPQLDWAGSGLSSEAIDDPTERIVAVHDETVAYLCEVWGANAKHRTAALQRVQQYDFATAPETEGEYLLEDLCDVLESFWPEKLAFQETTPTLEMISVAIDKAAGRGIVDPAGRCMVSTLCVIFGHDFEVDPLHPWAAVVLADPAIGDGPARSHALHRAALDRIANELTHDDGGQRE